MRNVYWLALPLLVAGCGSRYQLAAGKDGEYLRLDTRSGDMMLIRDGELIPLRSLNEASREWSNDTIPILAVRAKLKTRCRGTTLAYHVDVTPVPQAYSGQAAQPFTISLSDSAGFELVDAAVPRAQVTRMVGNAGEDAGLQLNGTTTVPAGACAELSSWLLKWTFRPDAAESSPPK